MTAETEPHHNIWYRRIRADPDAWAAQQARKAKNYQDRKARDPEFLSRQAELRKPKRLLGDGATKAKCRQQTQNAIRRGEIVKAPCEICGSEVSEVHHDDYSQPLLVRWLCRKHHAEHHSKERWSKRPDGPRL